MEIKVLFLPKGGVGSSEGLASPQYLIFIDS